MESKEKIGGNHAFFRDIKQTIILKSSEIQSVCIYMFQFHIFTLKAMYGGFYFLQIEA